MTRLETPSPYRFLIAVILFLSYAAFGLSWIAVTPLIGEIQAEYQINSTQFGLLNTLVTIAKVFAPLLTGLLAVRIGIKKTILLGSLFISCAALAPFAPDFNSFLASRFIFGVGGAIVVTLLSASAMQWFPKHELPLVNGFNNVAVNTGITVTLFLTVPLAGMLGWRKTLLAYGLVSVALLVAWALLGRDRATEPPSAAAAPVETARYRDIWRMKETWLIALVFAGPLALYLSFNTWLPKYYMEAFSMTKASAAQYTGMFNLIGIPTAILAGYLTQQLGLRRPFIIGAGALIGFAAFGMFLFNNPLIILASAIVLGICLFIASSPLMTLAMELPGMTPQKISLLMGTMLSFAYVLSSIAPLVVGFLRDMTGSFVPGFTVWAVGSWVVLLAGLFLPETGPRARKPVTESPAELVAST